MVYFLSFTKVDYLKAQLLSEAALKDDFVKAIEKLTKENERISTSARSRVLELENHKAQEILKVQEEVRSINFMFCLTCSSEKSHSIDIYIYIYIYI